MNLEQMASAQGIFWAEREYLFLCLRGHELPVEWHGTLDQARYIANVLVNHRIEARGLQSTRGAHPGAGSARLVLARREPAGELAPTGQVSPAELHSLHGCSAAPLTANRPPASAPPGRNPAAKAPRAKSSPAATVPARPAPPRHRSPRTPSAGPVAWRVVRLRGQPIEAEPIVANSWFLARQAAMIKYGAEPDEVDLAMIEPPEA